MRSRQPFSRVAVVSHEELLKALFEALEVDDSEDRERLHKRYFSALGIEAGVKTSEGGPPSSAMQEPHGWPPCKWRDPGNGDGPVDVPGARG